MAVHRLTLKLFFLPPAILIERCHLEEYQQDWVNTSIKREYRLGAGTRDAIASAIAWQCHCYRAELLYRSLKSAWGMKAQSPPCVTLL